MATRDARASCEDWVPYACFSEQEQSYPIRNVPDDVPGICYRSQAKGWMDNQTFIKWLSEPRAIKKDTFHRRRFLFVDNCSGHVENEDVYQALGAINTELRKLPKNATDLVQPADSFIISKIKDAWKRRWDDHNAQLIRNGEWMSGDDGSSGKLKNPGKRFFLKLAADSVREVNNQRDRNEISFARKVMIKTGMACNWNGRWEESQLFDELQAIIAKHRNELLCDPPKRLVQN